MLTFRMIDWMKIQQKMEEEGLTDIPKGRFVDSFRKGDYLYFLIDFDTPADEMWFTLKWI